MKELMSEQESNLLPPGPWESVLQSLGIKAPEFDPRSLAEFVEGYAATIPDNIALTYLDRHISYAELDVLSNKLANALSAQGIGLADVIGIHMPNIPHYAIILIAASKIGATVTGISTILSPREFVRQIEDAHVKILFSSEPLAEMMFGADLPVASCLQSLIVAGSGDFTDPAPVNLPGAGSLQSKSYLDFTSKEDEGFKALSLPADHIMLIQYTGGTTGPSKGAMLTLRGTMHNAVLSYVHRPWDVGRESVASALPFFHIGGMIFLIMAIRSGARFLVVPDPRDMEHFCQQMINCPPTRIGAVPTTYQMICENSLSNQIDFSNLVFAQTGAAAITGNDRARIEEMLQGTVLSDCFGMTETGPTLICNPPDRCKPEALGLPLPGVDLRIVDPETGAHELAYGEAGEIIASSPSLMAGYLNRPEETENALRPWKGKTWMFTGDIGVMDEEGYVYIRDRKKDMIIVSGFKVFSVEVENELAALEPIAASALIGVPDENRPGSEEVHLYVELTPEGKTQDPQSIRDEIIEFCRSNLAKYKIPKHIHFLEKIPLTPVGKVDKKRLRSKDPGSEI